MPVALPSIAIDSAKTHTDTCKHIQKQNYRLKQQTRAHSPNTINQIYDTSSFILDYIRTLAKSFKKKIFCFLVFFFLLFDFYWRKNKKKHKKTNRKESQLRSSIIKKWKVHIILGQRHKHTHTQTGTMCDHSMRAEKVTAANASMRMSVA